MTVKDTRIYDRLIKSVRDFAEGNYRVKLPNKSFKPSTYPYLSLNVIPVPVTGPTIDGKVRRVEGNLIINVIDQLDSGIGRAKAVTQIIIQEYPEGRVLFDNEIGITIHKQVNERSPVYSDATMSVPVIIPYLTFT